VRVAECQRAGHARIGATKPVQTIRRAEIARSLRNKRVGGTERRAAWRLAQPTRVRHYLHDPSNA